MAKQGKMNGRPPDTTYSKGLQQKMKKSNIKNI